ncbi:PKD domain-containing protein [Pontiella agarivorans]|uniref:DUF5060 domain-containing protein n=1 Tax=Pontiella agarivorans TaxID=3038953 RepID=A0ABU5MYS6_9BACT|nr:DUF5060 domain-containing protein [Pontiella agarivorans]MDZ8119126.1 DUF5060 domain-containing protein [Pontiella agarivorans]
MKLIRLSAFLTGCLLYTGIAQADVFKATTDFPVLTAGTADFYIDTGRGALAIDAAAENNRDKFARATTTFSGLENEYEIQLTTLQETDGESIYRVWVGNDLIGTVTNDPTLTDYVRQVHSFPFTTVTAGTELSVEAMAVSNGRIPEGSGFAYARGRWARLELIPTASGGNATISGEQKKWHKVSFSWIGPDTSETAVVNPFADYRLNVTFTHTDSGTSFRVPGYYAADGDAANSSATSGNVWRAHFAPNLTGEWTYSASFRTGTDVAVSDAEDAGTSAAYFDGDTGTFRIADTDKSGRDFRGKGRLTYVGKHLLQHAETGEYFLKAGTDAPENLLAYDDVDDTPNDMNDKPNLRKSWGPHATDYDAVDASEYTWGSGNGTELLGAIKYLSDKGLNAFSFLTFSLDGDDDNVFPHLLVNGTAAYEAVADDTRWDSGEIYKDRFDVSKMAQWEQIFAYGDKKGMHLNFKTQETENETLMDNGAIGRERKLYIRELIARFSHHLGLSWNMGEESQDQTTAQVIEMTQYFKKIDPYGHNIVLHTYPGKHEVRYRPMLGTLSELTGTAIQTGSAIFDDVFPAALKWVTESAAAGKPWIVAVDEPGDPRYALRDANDPGDSWTNARKDVLWAVTMAGGAGVEFYYGYQTDHSDLNCQDFRTRDGFFDYCRYELEFFKNNNIPLERMSNEDALLTDPENHCLRETGKLYVVQLKNGGTDTLDLSAAIGNFTVKWYDPRNGGDLQFGSITNVGGGGVVNLGTAPSEPASDWIVLLERMEGMVLENDIWIEKDGLVIFEAEDTRSDLGLWEELSTITPHLGTGYLDFMGNSAPGGPVNSPLEYRFHITKPGLYYLHMHVARVTVGDRTDVANDCYVRVDGDYTAHPDAGTRWNDPATLSVLEEDTKLFGGKHNQFVWRAGPCLDPESGSDKVIPIYHFKAGETYSLWMSGRSKWFKADRIMFRHADVDVTEAQLLTNPTSQRGGLVTSSPNVNAGDDQTITLPENSATFEGSATDLGTVISTVWMQLEGPTTATLSGTNTTTLTASDLTEGVYRFQLTAVDDDGDSSSDDVSVTVVDPASWPTGTISLHADNPFVDYDVSTLDNPSMTLSTPINRNASDTGRTIGQSFTANSDLELGHIVLKTVGGSDLSTIASLPTIMLAILDMSDTSIIHRENFELTGLNVTSGDYVSFNLHSPVSLIAGGKYSFHLAYNTDDGAVDNTFNFRRTGNSSTVYDGGQAYDTSGTSLISWPLETLTTKSRDMEFGIAAYIESVGYENWLSDYGLPASTDPLSDYDGDGASNLDEYAMGGDPTDPAIGPNKPRLVINPNGNVSIYNMELNSPSTDLEYKVQWTTNMISGPWNESWNLIATNTATNPKLNEIRRRVWGENKDSIFFRVEVTRP